MVILTLCYNAFSVLISYPIISDSVTAESGLSCHPGVLWFYQWPICHVLIWRELLQIHFFIDYACPVLEDNLILAILHLTFITGMGIHTHEFRGSFPAL